MNELERLRIRFQYYLNSTCLSKSRLSCYKVDKPVREAIKVLHLKVDKILCNRLVRNVSVITDDIAGEINNENLW